MVAILGANSLSGGGYEIDNSLRFNDGDSSQLDKTFGSAGDLDKSTVSMWIKISTLASTPNAANYPFIARNSSSHEMGIRIRNTDVLQWYYYNGSYTMNLTTNRVLRDTSAWYHIVAVYDSENGTEAHRARLYVNGVEETSFSASVYPSQNTDGILGNDITHSIGGYPTSGGQFDGYISEMHYVNGSVKAPTDFGEVNDNGVWIPKTYTGAYGTNGFYLEFKETGTGTDASGMGADTSGNDNHWAVTNLAATDVVIDTPTNNFATFNPLIAPPNKATFSEGNLKSVTPATGNQGGLATQGVSTGKWYVEFKYIAKSGDRRVNVGQVRDLSPFNSANTVLGVNTTSVGYRSVDGQMLYNSGLTSYGATYDVGDIIGVALDLDNGYIYFSKNNTWQNSGVPTSGATGTGGISNSISIGEFHFIGFSDATGSGSETITANYGQDSSFAGTETAQNNADGNGYGLYKYTPPSGYYSLCTKNLAEFG